MNRLTIAAVLLSSLIGASAQATEYRSGAEQRSSLSLTVYNGGRALVREQRRLPLASPTDRIALMDVPQRILPQTLSLQGLPVREQNYDFDLLTPQTLLQKHVGRRVRLARRSRDSGETLEWTRARVLAVNSGVILRLDDGRIETLPSDGTYRIVYEELPPNLRERPTLSLRLSEAVSGNRDIRLDYLTGGLGWSSDYVLRLSADGDSGRLVDWITVDNQSGAAYRNARLQLLAGDVNTVSTRNPPQRKVMAMAAEVMDAPVQRESIGGFHLYSLPYATDLKDKQKKQLQLFARDAVPLERFLVDRAWFGGYSSQPQKSKPELKLRLSNREPALGLPLPAGIVRVYGPDSQGRTQFLGEDRIGHTAVNDTVTLTLGRSFDVSVQRRSTDYRQISKKQQRITREILVNNGGEQQQSLKLYETLPGLDWQVLSANRKWSKASPQELLFDLNLPPKSQLRIEYQVEIRQP